MQVSSTSSGAAAAVASADTSNRVVQKTLGQDDFLKLLTVQLAQQDPMKPMDDTAFIAQMAQFTSLQQMTALNGGLAALRQDTQLSAAESLIGREVTLTRDDGTLVTGVVDSVARTDAGPRLSIGDQTYDYALVTRVSPAPAPQLPSTPAGDGDAA